jgi:CheY-like chemotaxis protein
VFDLVLMDVQMPVMDGLAATRAIRELERSTGRTRTPIISITANAMPEDVRRSLDAGSDTHLAKPIRPDKLIDAVNKALTPEPASTLKAVA